MVRSYGKIGSYHVAGGDGKDHAAPQLAVTMMEAGDIYCATGLPSEHVTTLQFKKIIQSNCQRALQHQYC
jgi:hypothetical protein